ncbi:hypothetical protein CsatA_005511 [Cannabis sativa]
MMMMMMEEYQCPRWSELLPEALALIFTKLPLKDKLSPTFPLVCKPWSKVVARPYCWQDIDINREEFEGLFVGIKRLSSRFLKVLPMLIKRCSGQLHSLSAPCLLNDSSLPLIANS